MTDITMPTDVACATRFLPGTGVQSSSVGRVFALTANCSMHNASHELLTCHITHISANVRFKTHKNSC